MVSTTVIEESLEFVTLSSKIVPIVNNAIPKKDYRPISDTTAGTTKVVEFGELIRVIVLETTHYSHKYLSTQREVVRTGYKEDFKEILMFNKLVKSKQ